MGCNCSYRKRETQVRMRVAGPEIKTYLVPDRITLPSIVRQTLGQSPQSCPHRARLIIDQCSQNALKFVLFLPDLGADSRERRVRERKNAHEAAVNPNARHQTLNPGTKGSFSLSMSFVPSFRRPQFLEITKTRVNGRVDKLINFSRFCSPGSIGES